MPSSRVADCDEPHRGSPGRDVTVLTTLQTRADAKKAAVQ